MRPDWDTYFAGIVDSVASRSTCLKRKVGAVIVDQSHSIVATGYNGPARGVEHCTSCELEESDEYFYDKCPAVHAEANALLFAGKQAKGCTLYVNCLPCVMCARLIINSEVRKVVVTDGFDYYDKKGIALLSKYVEVYGRGSRLRVWACPNCKSENIFEEEALRGEYLLICKDCGNYEEIEI